MLSNSLIILKDLRELTKIDKLLNLKTVNALGRTIRKGCSNVCVNGIDLLGVETKCCNRDLCNSAYTTKASMLAIGFIISSLLFKLL